MEIVKLKDLEIKISLSTLKKIINAKISVKFKIIGVIAIDANLPKVFM